MNVRLCLRKLCRSLFADTCATSAVEYGLIIALVVLTMIVGVTSVANGTSGMWNNINDKVTKAR